MEGFKAFLKRKNIKISAKHYGIDALGAMAQGLFCSLLIGTIIKTLGQQLSIQYLIDIGAYAMAVSGPAMAVAIGYALKADPMVLFSLAAVGWAANAEGGAGGPLAVLIIAIIAAECGKMVSKETKVDILVTAPLESRGYVDLTLDVLDRFGVVAEPRENGFHIPSGQMYQARDLAVEADWSQAAFWYAANHLGGQVDILGMDPASRQGDREIAAYSRMLARSGQVELDVSQCPDLAPPLAAMAAVRTGTTRLTNAARLRAKESDRLASVTRALRAMGGQVEEYADSLTIHGVKRLPGGGVVDCANDHRIAMMAAVCAASAEAPVKLLGAECVRKSYPEFWTHFQLLGGELHGLILR